MDITQYLPSVAGGGTALIVGYGLALLKEWVQQLREGKLQAKKLDMAEDAQHVTDAAAANAILLASLQDLRVDLQQKDARIDALETRNAEKDSKIEFLQSEVRALRAELHAMGRRLDGVDFELDDLKDKP